MLRQIFRAEAPVKDHTLSAPAELQLAGIGAQFGADLSAQQLPDGSVQRLAADIPECGVDSADGAEGDDTAALPPEGVMEQVVPDRFIGHGIHANAEGGQLPQHAHRAKCSGIKADRSLTAAIKPFVGIDPADDGAPAGAAAVQQKNFHTSDFHAMLRAPFPFLHN